MVDATSSFTIPQAPRGTGTPTRISERKSLLERPTVDIAVPDVLMYLDGIKGQMKVHMKQKAEEEQLKKEEAEWLAETEDERTQSVALVDIIQNGESSEAKKKERKETYRKLTVRAAKQETEIKEAVLRAKNLIAIIPSSSLNTASTTIANKSNDNESSKLASTKGVTHGATEEGELFQVFSKLSLTTQQLNKEKTLLEDSVKCLTKELARVKAEYAEQLSQMQSLVLKLKDDNKAANSRVTALRLQFEGQIKTLTENLHEAKQQQTFLNHQNVLLLEKKEELETRLFEVPKLEETYLKTARNIVVQKDKQMFAKDMQIRRFEKDVSQVEYWRSKAQVNEVEVARLKHEAEDLRKQNVLILHDYHALLDKSTKAAHGVSSRPRSPSPPPTKRTSALSRPASPTLDPGRAKTDELDVTTLELIRAKALNEQLFAKIESLNFKLSNARAYPLVNTVSNGTATSGNTTSQFVTKADRARQAVKSVSELFESDDDDTIPDEDTYKANAKQAKELESKRIVRALSFQQGFVSQLQDIRAARPKSATLGATRIDRGNSARGRR